MAACFLTHQGTLLCFGRDDVDFRQATLADLDDAALVVADADADALRAGQFAGQPVALRPLNPARSGLPRTVGIGAAETSGTVSLVWRAAYLCAGGSGGNVNLSDRVAAWEEFLPVSIGDMALLRDLARRGWETERGRRFGPGSVELRAEFMLQAGDWTIDLRRHPTLGGEQAVRDGKTVLLVDGWRIEALRRYEPLVVWRHDGTDAADEELVLGVRSMAAHGGYDGPVHVETRLDAAEFSQRCGVDDGRLRVVAPPDGSSGLLPWDRGLGSDEAARGPILLLANGVTCHRALDPLLRSLVTADKVALMPWQWTAGQAIVEEAALFVEDPAEAPAMQRSCGAVVGLPGWHRSDTISRLVSTIAAERAPPQNGQEGFEDALLQYVVRRTGAACTTLLSGFAVTASVAEEQRALVRPTLVNHRPLPAAIRIDAMRTSLDEALR